MVVSRQASSSPQPVSAAEQKQANKQPESFDLNHLRLLFEKKKKKRPERYEFYCLDTKLELYTVKNH